mgnify:CR=1 FL=1
MKRTFAAVTLLAALGVFLKLGVKSGQDARPTSEDEHTRIAAAPATGRERADDFLDRYRSHPEADRVLVARVWEKFRQTAVVID